MAFQSLNSRNYVIGDTRASSGDESFIHRPPHKLCATPNLEILHSSMMPPLLLISPAMPFINTIHLNCLTAYIYQLDPHRLLTFYPFGPFRSIDFALLP